MPEAMPTTVQPAAPNPPARRRNMPAHKRTRSRRRTRAVVMQSLYEADAAKHPPTDVLKAHIVDAALLPEDETFAHAVVDGVIANVEEIDKVIAGFAPNWPIGQMAVVDRNILRMAIYEIMFSQDTPPKVAVNEAVELAKAFGADSAPRFVNGVLGSVMAAQGARH